MQNEGNDGTPDNLQEQRYERILKAREAGAKALKENKVVVFEETEKGEGRRKKRHKKHEWMADEQPIKRFIGTHLMREPSNKVPVSIRERVGNYNEGVDKLTQSPKKLKKFLGWCLRVGIPTVVIGGAIIFLYGKYVVGGETAASGITAVDRANRQARYALFATDDGVDNTDAEKWANNQWTGYSSHDFFVNLNPAGPYTEPKAFVENCGSQCFFDPNKFPSGGRSVIEEILGLTPAEYDYYSSNRSSWDSIKGGLIERLRQKYPNDPWFPELFNISPTDLKSKQPSDFENWYNKWHEVKPQGFNPNITTTRGRIQAVGIEQFKNAFAGQRNFRGITGKGGGFGTTKGFS